MERIELLVYSGSDLTRPLETIGTRHRPQFLEEHNGDGGGSFRIRLNDPLVEDERKLFQKGRVVKARIAGRDVGYWEIQKDTRIVVDEGEYSGEWIEYAGPSVRDWLSHAIVLPEKGLSQVNGDDRYFNYASGAGAWYVAAEWKNAVSVGKVLDAGAYWAHRTGSPTGWPKAAEAWWLWDRPMGATPAMPAGDVYFRRTFTTTATRKYRIIATADDASVISIDGSPVMRTNYWPKVFETDVELDSGNHVIAIKGRNAAFAAGPAAAGVVLAMFNLPEDGVKETVDFTNADRFLWTEATSGNWKVNGYPPRPPGYSVGGILTTLLSEGKARGVDRLQQITTDFSHTADSYGKPWPTTIDPTYGVGDNLAEIVKQVTDSYADVWLSPGMVLRCAPTRGSDRSTGAGQVAFRKGHNIISASTESVAEISNVVYAKTRSNYVETAGPADSLSQYGRRETYISAVNASAEGTAPYLIQQVFQKFAHERRTPTLRIYTGEAVIPWRDFAVGDWILAPSDDGDQMIKRRIVSIAVAEDEDTGRLEYTCEIDTIQETLEQRLTRWLTELGDQSKEGGVSGTSRGVQGESDIPLLNGGGGNPVTVIADERAPAAPGGLVVTTDVSLTDTGQQAGRMSVSWTHSGLAENGSSQTPRLYEVWARVEGVGNFKQIGGTAGTSVSIFPLPALAVNGTALRYEVYVVAVGANGYSSQPSGIVAVSMSKDTVAPLQPAVPTVAAVRGVFTVYYTGLDLNGAAMARDTHRVLVQSRTGSGLWIDKGPIGFTGTGSLTIGDLPYGTHAFRLIAYDYAGNASTPSAVATATADPMVADSQTQAALDKLTADLGANVTATTAAAADADQALLDAQAALTAAQNADGDASAAATLAQKGVDDAKAAFDKAEAARLAAVAAQTSVNGKVTVSQLAPTAADLTGKPAMSLWTQVVSGKQVGAWYKATDAAPGWTPMPFDPVLIPQIAIGTGTFGDLDGVRITAKTIGARELAVGDFENYAPGGNFDYPSDLLVNWNGYSTSRVSVVPSSTTAPASGVGSLQVLPGTGTTSVARISPVPVTAGERWKFDYQVKMSSTWNGLADNSKLRIADQDNGLRTSITHGPLTTGWQPRSTEYVIPAGMTLLNPSLVFDHTAGTIWVDGFKVRRMNAGELTIDGTLTARKINLNEFFADNGVVGKLTAQMAVFLTNEDGTGAKSTVTGQGLRVTWTDAATGEVQERVRVGTFGDDYISLTGDDGQPASSMDKDGNISGRNVIAGSTLWYRGDEMQTILDRLPWGVLAAAGRITNPSFNAWSGGPSQPYLRVDVMLEPGRLYKIWTSPIRAGLEDNTELIVSMGFNWDEAATVFNRNIIAFEYLNRERESATLQELFANLGTTRRLCSFIIDYAVYGGAGQGAVRASATNPIRLVVEDVGPQTRDNISWGIALNGPPKPAAGTTAPAPVSPAVQKQDTFAVNRTGVRSYTGTNATYAFNTSKGYQGPSPAGYGNLKSIWTFESVTARLAGATIQEIWVFFYFDHWYFDNGGYARIGVHGHTTPPATFSFSGTHQGSDNWPKASGRWVKLPSSLHAGFQNGTYKGVTLEGDGTNRTYGSATDCSLKFIFVK